MFLLCDCILFIQSKFKKKNFTVWSKFWWNHVHTLADLCIRIWKRQKTWNTTSIHHSTGVTFTKTDLTLIGMRQDTFTPLVILGLYFVSWICIKNFQTFFENWHQSGWFDILTWAFLLFSELMPIKVK